MRRPGGITLDPETYKLFCEQDWVAIYQQLTAFAVSRARNCRWRRGRAGDLAAGKTAADVVQDVILDTIADKRKWDPQKGALLPWLFDQVRSEISHLLYSAAHKHEVPLAGTESDGSLATSHELYARQGALGITATEDPEETLLTKEEIQQREDALFRAADGDPELEALLAAVANCEFKPRYLAAELGIPVKDVYNQVKRLRQRALRLLERENS